MSKRATLLNPEVIEIDLGAAVDRVIAKRGDDSGSAPRRVPRKVDLDLVPLAVGRHRKTNRLVVSAPGRVQIGDPEKATFRMVAAAPGARDPVPRVASQRTDSEGRWLRTSGSNPAVRLYEREISSSSAWLMTASRLANPSGARSSTTSMHRSGPTWRFACTMAAVAGRRGASETAPRAPPQSRAASAR